MAGFHRTLIPYLCKFFAEIRINGMNFAKNLANIWLIQKYLVYQTVPGNSLIHQIFLYEPDISQIFCEIHPINPNFSKKFTKIRYERAVKSGHCRDLP